MKNKPLITIIVPIYKVEYYLRKCINSILEQTYSNLEIILIDDGSPDNCLTICNSYAEKDARIRVIHKNNGGVSSARNIGIEASTGEYICFVDPDDWLPNESIELLFSGMKDDHTDLVIGATRFIGSVRNHRQSMKQVRIKKNGNGWASFVSNLHGGPWAKLYKAETICGNNLLFRKDVKLGEDTIFLYQYLNLWAQLQFLLMESKMGMAQQAPICLQ